MNGINTGGIRECEPGGVAKTNSFKRKSRLQEEGRNEIGQTEIARSALQVNIVHHKVAAGARRVRIIDDAEVIGACL